jgi:hypothetical protein
MSYDVRDEERCYEHYDTDEQKLNKKHNSTHMLKPPRRSKRGGLASLTRFGRAPNRLGDGCSFLLSYRLFKRQADSRASPVQQPVRTPTVVP